MDGTNASLPRDAFKCNHAPAAFLLHHAQDRSNEANMSMLNIVGWPRTTPHNTRREGFRLGILVATVTWLWVALVDAAAGHPFYTFTALGGALVFTGMHYLLNILYGVVLLSAIHGAERAPSLILAVIFGLVTFEGAFAMFTNILAQSSLGNTAWIGLFGGSLLATALAIVLLSRTHPLAAHLRRAEDER
jgi:hypothetical protein